MNEQKVEQAKQFLNDYVLTDHQKIENWFSGVSRQDFGAELISLRFLHFRGMIYGTKFKR